MAVWMQIIGFRKYDSLESEKERIRKILNSMSFDLDSIGQFLNIELNDTQWVLKESKGVEYFELSLQDQNLKILFDNPNFLNFSGSLDLFGAWFWFASKDQVDLTNGIRRIFRKIAIAYGLSELFYFSEWCFPVDEIRTKEETFENLIRCLNNNPEKQQDEFFGLKAQEFYVEKLNLNDNNED